METTTLSKLFDSTTVKALGAVKKNIDPFWESNNAERWEPPELENRITWGLGKRNKKLIISLIVDKSDSSAERIAIELVNEFPNYIVFTTGGIAQSSKTARKASKQGVNIKKKIRPGILLGIHEAQQEQWVP